MVTTMYLRINVISPLGASSTPLQTIRLHHDEFERAQYPDESISTRAIENGIWV